MPEQGTPNRDPAKGSAKEKGEAQRNSKGRSESE
jgi:hypothetical protein